MTQLGMASPTRPERQRQRALERQRHRLSRRGYREFFRAIKDQPTRDLKIASCVFLFAALGMDIGPGAAAAALAISLAAALTLGYWVWRVWGASAK